MQSAGRLGAYAPPAPAFTKFGFASSFPSWQFYPKPGSPWDQVLKAWSGNPGDTINVPALGIANMQPMVQALQNQGYNNVGDYLSGPEGVWTNGYTGPTVLDSIFAVVLPYIYFWTPDANGNLIASKTIYDTPLTWQAKLVIAIFAVMGGEIVGAAAGAGAVAGEAGAGAIDASDAAIDVDEFGDIDELSDADDLSDIDDVTDIPQDPMQPTSVSSNATATGTSNPADTPGSAGYDAPAGDGEAPAGDEETDLPEEDTNQPAGSSSSDTTTEPAAGSGGSGTPEDPPTSISMPDQLTPGNLAKAASALAKLLGAGAAIKGGASALQTNPDGTYAGTGAGSIGGLALIAAAVYFLFKR